MKTLTSAATTHLAKEVTTLAMCWKLSRTDGVVLGFTDYHEDLVVAGVVYKASSGMVRATAVSGASDLSVDNLDVETLLDSAAISRTDVLIGRYDYAELHVFLVDYYFPDAFLIKLARGRLGQASVGQIDARTEFRSLKQLLKQRIGRSHEVDCPWDLGDAKCGVNLASFTVAGTVTSFANRHQFIDTARSEADRWFDGGKLTWTSGLNNGLPMEVKRYTSATKQFTLSLDMPFNIAIGDGYSVHAGCAKDYPTCVAKFNNKNYGGFPHIPGTDWLLSGPDRPQS
ncbi:MAG: DUF2163 domain-containing protein [Gammaproteobacteria bacterium]